MHLRDELVNLWLGHWFGKPLGFPMMLHALLAAANLK